LIDAIKALRIVLAAMNEAKGIEGIDAVKHIMQTYYGVDKVVILVPA
jgi:hypothetical protein